MEKNMCISRTLTYILTKLHISDMQAAKAASWWFGKGEEKVLESLDWNPSRDAINSSLFGMLMATPSSTTEDNSAGKLRRGLGSSRKKLTSFFSDLILGPKKIEEDFFDFLYKFSLLFQIWWKVQCQTAFSITSKWRFIAFIQVGLIIPPWF